VAPTPVPIMRKKPLRNEEPRIDRHTMAAEPPAQDGLSSSRVKAMNSAKHTAVANRRP